MAKPEAFDNLIYELGDKARDVLAEMTPPLATMVRVFQAEDQVLARRQELEVLEDELNDADAAHQEFVVQQEAERAELQGVVKKYRKAVDAIEDKVKDLRKKLAAARAESKLNRVGLKTAETRQADLEMTRPDPVRAEQGRQGLKRLRVSALRKEREIIEMEELLRQHLTPDETRPGFQGIAAHRRILEMEDEATARQEQNDEQVKEIDSRVAAKDAELREVEAELNEALFRLGEECYAQRVSEPTLNAIYARLDKLK